MRGDARLSAGYVLISLPPPHPVWPYALARLASSARLAAPIPSLARPMQVNMIEAKNPLSRLVKAALAGEEVIIANHGVPAVRRLPIGEPRRTGGWV